MEKSFVNASFILPLLAWMGWLIVLLGGALALISIGENGFGAQMVSGLMLAGLGLGVVIAVEVALAQIVTATNTSEMLKEMRRIMPDNSASAVAAPSAAKAAPRQ